MRNNVWDILRASAFAVALFASSFAVQAQHENDPPVIGAEHRALFDLVPHDAATHVAVADGDWNDPATWFGTEVPGDLSKVVIPAGRTVNISSVNRTVHKWIRVDGTLTFSTDRNTGLMVDTLIVDPAGHVQMGTAADPVQAGVKCKVIIADTGAIDINWDPNEFSRGFISHGRFTAHGQVKTPHAMLAKEAKRRAKKLTLDGTPAGWEVGDVLILPGSHSRRDFDETLVVTKITGKDVHVVGLTDAGAIDRGWRGLHNRHRLPNGKLPFVINVSRNVVIESQNVEHADEYGINRRRGHIMFMHSGVGKTDARYLGVYGLGRTDKRTPLESPEFDENGNRIPDRGHNTVGRYAFHFHRGGPAKAHATVVGLAIVDSPGLGLVNHSSHVQVSDSVAYNVVGSAFFTEAGDEIGFFENCTAVRMTGSGEGLQSRSKAAGVIQEIDFGHGGHGFWLQGGGVAVRNARVSGSGDSAIIFFTVALNEAGLGKARFDSSLAAPEVAMGRATVPVAQIPATLDGAYVFACRKGIETKFHQLSSRHGVKTRITNADTVWAGTPISVQYTRHFTIADSTFTGNTRRPGGSFMRRNSVTGWGNFENLNVRGWYWGVNVPLRGLNQIIGGSYENVRDIYISTTMDDNRLVQILGDIRFPDLTDRQLTRYNRRTRQTYVLKRHHVYLRTNYNPKHNDLTRLFARDIIRLGTLKYNDHQLFYYAQAADFVPFKSGSAASYVPPELIDKSNAQLWAEYGMAIGDAVAPADAFEDPVIHALIGAPIEYAPKVRLRNRKYTNRLNNYRFQYHVWRSDGRRHFVRWRDRINLREDWNLVTFEEEGHKRTLMIFGDITPPEFVLGNRDLTVNPADLRRGFRIVGRILDNSFGSKMFRKTFRGSHLKKLPLLTREDGSQYIELNFWVQDFARNRTAVTVELTVDPNEPLDHVKRRKWLKKRKTAKALLFLLGFDEES